MKKSKEVPATLLIAIAGLILGGCSNRSQVRRCVDASGNVMADSACMNGTGTYTTGGGTGYGNNYYSRPHWMYGGSYGGGRLSGGSTTPADGADVVDGGGHTISRGGMGGGGGGGS